MINVYPHTLPFQYPFPRKSTFKSVFFHVLYGLPSVCTYQRFSLSVKYKYFLTHTFKHMIWVTKTNVLLRRFFLVPTTYVLVEK